MVLRIATADWTIWKGIALSGPIDSVAHRDLRKLHLDNDGRVRALAANHCPSVAGHGLKAAHVIASGPLVGVGAGLALSIADAGLQVLNGGIVLLGVGKPQAWRR